MDIELMEKLFLFMFPFLFWGVMIGINLGYDLMR